MLTQCCKWLGSKSSLLAMMPFNPLLIFQGEGLIYGRSSCQRLLPQAKCTNQLSAILQAVLLLFGILSVYYADYGIFNSSFPHFKRGTKG
jgi:hypothetical protein